MMLYNTYIEASEHTKGKTMNYQITMQQMTGYTKALVNARNFVYSANELWFDISISGKRGHFKVEISLHNDTYTVKLLKLNRKLELVTLKTVADVYVSMLNAVVQNFVIEGW